MIFRSVSIVVHCKSHIRRKKCTNPYRWAHVFIVNIYVCVRVPCSNEKKYNNKLIKFFRTFSRRPSVPLLLLPKTLVTHFHSGGSNKLKVNPIFSAYVCKLAKSSPLLEFVISSSEFHYRRKFSTGHPWLFDSLNFNHKCEASSERGGGQWQKFRASV